MVAMKGSRAVLLDLEKDLHLYVEMELECGNGALVYREAADLKVQVLGTVQHSTVSQFTFRSCKFLTLGEIYFIL